MEKEYLKDDGSGYGSHIKPLQFIFQHIIVTNAIELGMGMYSTGFLIDHAKALTSIEMQERKWYDIMLTKLPKSNWHPICELGDLQFMVHIPVAQIYDFALVDGAAATRAAAVNYFLEAALQVVVAHDTESSWYGWHHVRVPDGYYAHTFKTVAPWTTVWTRDEKLIKALKVL